MDQCPGDEGSGLADRCADERECLGGGTMTFKGYLRLRELLLSLLQIGDIGRDLLEAVS